MDTKKDKKVADDPIKEYPGVAVNKADNDKDDECLQKQSTKQLNNNPRNHDM